MNDRGNDARNVPRIFEAAVELAGAERDAYLDQACAGAPELRAQVAALLDADQDAGQAPNPLQLLGRVPVAPIAETTCHGLTVGQKVGNYRIVGTVGQGGMGTVYEARHETLDCRAAVKVLHHKLRGDHDLQRRFLAEAKAAAKLEHPGIVQVIDIGVLDGGDLYILMEFLAGETLASRIRSARLSERHVVSLARQIADALGAVHQSRIVHCDLKPDNILLVPDMVANGGERIKLLDFGIARLLSELDGDHAGPAQVMGTPPYMAPEQWRGIHRVDHRTDLYALGVILFEMLTRRRPFEFDVRADAEGQARDYEAYYRRAHCHRTPPRVRQYRPDVSSELDDLIAWLLAKSPDHRLGSAADLQLELDQLHTELYSPALLAHLAAQQSKLDRHTFRGHQVGKRPPRPTVETARYRGSVVSAPPAPASQPRPRSDLARPAATEPPDSSRSPTPGPAAPAAPTVTARPIHAPRAPGGSGTPRASAATAATGHDRPPPQAASAAPTTEASGHDHSARPVDTTAMQGEPYEPPPVPRLDDATEVCRQPRPPLLGRLTLASTALASALALLATLWPVDGHVGVEELPRSSLERSDVDALARLGDEARASLHEQLEFGPPELKCRVVEAVAQVGSDQAGLLPMALHDAPELRRCAALAYRSLHWPEAAGPIRSAMSRAGGRLRTDLAISLLALGGRDALPIVMDALSGDAQGLALEAALVLAESGPAEAVEPARAVLERALRVHQPADRAWSWAARGLLALGDDDLRATLARMLADPDLDRAMTAAVLLAERDDPAALAYLGRVVAEPGFPRRGQAALVLARRGDPAALAAVEAGLTHTDPEQRRLAVLVLGRLAGHGAAAFAPAVAALADVGGAGLDPDPEVRIAARLTLLALAPALTSTGDAPR
ncbi:protein kinase domain-containing protein [Haliangium sp.]|uniref:protein kinase domain-containing protein n=1 Tax=Haliangium sp. TaxID=2663208 RepID=UPI003D0980FD